VRVNPEAAALSRQRPTTDSAESLYLLIKPIAFRRRWSCCLMARAHQYFF
jgi:hypothetical protein